MGPVRRVLQGAVVIAALAGCSDDGDGVVIGAPVTGPATAGSGTPAGGTVTPTATSTGRATPAATEAPDRAATLSGTVYAYVTATDVAEQKITVDVVEWFAGAAAKKACAEDGQGESGAWCTNYYIRNRNPLKRTLPLAEHATITLPGGTPDMSADALGKVALGDPYRLEVDGPTITGMAAIYVP